MTRVWGPSFSIGDLSWGSPDAHGSGHRRAGPLWVRVVYTASHGAHLSSVPSGDRSANPATDGASGHRGLQWTLWGSPEQLEQPSPAGPPLQGTELAALSTPEVSLRRLVPLVDYLANYCQMWFDGSIQFSAPQPIFNDVILTPSGSRVGSGNGTRSEYSLEEGGHRGGPSSWQRVRFLQPYLIVPKKDGGVASYFRSASFKPLIHATEVQDALFEQVVSRTRSEDWLVTIELKDTYFHISVLPHHREFLRFSFWGKVYLHRVLSFGHVLSPHTFTKCVDAALALLWPQGIRIRNHIDVWLILAQSYSERMAVWHWDAVLVHTKELGLRLKARKDCFLKYREPLIWVWCGIRPWCRHICLLLESSRSLLQSREWEKAVHSLSSSFSNCWVWRQLRPTRYILACCTRDPVQWWLKTKGFSPRGNRLCMIKVTRELLVAA